MKTPPADLNMNGHVDGHDLTTLVNNFGVDTITFSAGNIVCPLLHPRDGGVQTGVDDTIDSSDLGAFLCDFDACRVDDPLDLDDEELYPFP